MNLWDYCSLRYIGFSDEVHKLVRVRWAKWNKMLSVQIWWNFRWVKNIGGDDCGQRLKGFPWGLVVLPSSTSCIFHLSMRLFACVMDTSLSSGTNPSSSYYYVQWRLCTTGIFPFGLLFQIRLMWWEHDMALRLCLTRHKIFKMRDIFFG